MMKYLPCLFAIALLGSSLTNLCSQDWASYRETIKLMGSRFELTALATTDTLAWKAVQSGIEEIRRIERLISSWDPNSQTSAVNRYAGDHPVEVDPELFQLIARAQKVARLTNGAFDISFASMERIWTFDGTEQTWPPSEQIEAARQFVDWQKIELNPTEHTVFLQEKGMKIGFGAIGKGYAANRAKMIMEGLPQVLGGLVNAGGDLISWGQSPTPGGWQIKIAHPQFEEQILGSLDVGNLAVVTSGDYERFFTIDGKRYAHIIDPRTGYPTTEIKSATVICPDAELADALATSIIVLGPAAGLALINRLNAIECLIVTSDNSLLTSHNLQLNLQP